MCRAWTQDLAKFRPQFLDAGSNLAHLLTLVVKCLAAARPWPTEKLDFRDLLEVQVSEH